MELHNIPMVTSRSEDKRLTRLTEIAIALPETTRQIYGSHAQFLVRKKTFAYFLDNHHGDGIVAVTCKVLPGENKALVDAQPERFYLPAYIGSRGWVALRLDRGNIDWSEVKELLLGSYVVTAPKRFAEQVMKEVRSLSCLSAERDRGSDLVRSRSIPTHYGMRRQGFLPLGRNDRMVECESIRSANDALKRAARPARDASARRLRCPLRVAGSARCHPAHSAGSA